MSSCRLKSWSRVVLLVACLVLVAAASDGDAAVGTAFTYQGRLDLKGAPANGHFEDEPDNWEPGETSRRSPAGSSTKKVPGTAS